MSKSDKSEVLNEKIEKCAEILDPLNKNHSCERIRKCLYELGIYDDETSHDLLLSKHCKFGYAREVFVDNNKVPIVLFSKMWEILKGEENEPEQIISVDESVTSIGQYSNRQLLDLYDINCSPAIEEELKKRSKGRNVIAFASDNKDVIDKAVTLKFLKLSKHQVTSPEWIDGDGNMFMLYPVGTWPNREYHICPVTYSVLIDDYCDQLGVSWSKISHECRQFIYVMSKNGFKFDLMNITQVMDIADNGGLTALKRRFVKISSIYENMKSKGTLPTLISNTYIKPSTKTNIHTPNIIRY